MDEPGNRFAPQRLEDYIASYADISLDAITNKIDTNPGTTTKGPITDPEGRLAPAKLVPWSDGFEVLDDIFLCLRALAAPENNNTPLYFPYRDHVIQTGHELSAVNSEAAVHLFDVDTIYKPAKRIIDAALERPSSLRLSITPLLQRRGYTTNGALPDGQVVFSAHSRTINVPSHIAGLKRKRPASQSPSGSDQHKSENEEDLDNSQDEIQVSMSDAPALNEANDIGGRARTEPDTIKTKSGPGNYFCSFVSNTISEDRFCRQLMVGEAKAPHKLTRELVESALGQSTITIDTRRLIQPHRSHTPSRDAPVDIFSRTSDSHANDSVDQRWLAAVATQLYSTLVKMELRYGYVTTGQSYILVRIHPGDPTTLDYLLLPILTKQPIRQEQGQTDATWLDWLAATPLSRLSCLALLSLFADGQLSPAEAAQAQAATTTAIWRTPRHREQSFDSKRSTSGTSSNTKSFGDQEWTELGQNTRKRTCPTNNPEGDQHSMFKRLRKPVLQSVESKPFQPAVYLTPPPYQSCVQEPATFVSKTDAIRSVPFCTSLCIHSLACRTDGSVYDGDPLCPNWAVHTQQNQQSPPPSPSRLRALARQCIKLPLYIINDFFPEDFPPRVLDEHRQNCMYMGRYGAVSALFKVHIQPGGYVLVAKAARTTDEYTDVEVVDRLRHEASVYAKLSALQGRVIPVCLGLVNYLTGPGGSEIPRKGDNLRRFSGVLLLSWAGHSLQAKGPNMTMDTEAKRAWFERVRASMVSGLDAIHGLGRLHGDAAARNFVMSDDGNVTLLDFERSISQRRFSRPLIRQGLKATDDMETRFQHACLRETDECLGELDAWSERILSRKDAEVP
ncbi:hypothetical protein F5883DRAFT_122214 [Diaporthe sp. PMI_573]|nr:hypothetical protein F5883DRAFT_122214 [Diaporthaceae sp. PMI_573]